jgi:predicted metal-binding protein
MSAVEIKRRPTKWEEVLLVCRKCGKRAGGGFGKDGRKRLAKALRRELKLEKGRCARVGVMEVGCLGLCPKDAVTVVRGSQPGAMLAVPVGAPVEEVAAALGLPAQGS